MNRSINRPQLLNQALLHEIWTKVI